MIYAYPYLPRTGLGNMLFPWARAVVFCKNNNAMMIHPRWARITRIGPWIRGERYKRYYGNCFHVGKDEVAFLGKYIKLLLLRQVAESDCETLLSRINRNMDAIVRFEGMKDFFEPFLWCPSLVYDALLSIVNKDILEAVQCIADNGPYLAVHVRRGDFRQAGCLTEDSWYIHAVRTAFKLPEMTSVNTVRIYSDGYPNDNMSLVHQIKDIRNVTNVELMPKAPAIHDILSLSKGVALVGSPRSTFSMWGAFLGGLDGQISIWDNCTSPRVNTDKNKMIVA